MQDSASIFSAAALLDVPYDSSAGSYIDFARVIRRLSAQPKVDLEELFRRMVFNLLIDNSDDHLKNHGMLCVGGRYVLSPAFDVVPQLSNLGYQMLSIDGSTQESSLELAIEAAPHFDFTKDEARAIARAMAAVVYGPWGLQSLSVPAAPEVLRQRLQACFQRQKAIIRAAVFLLVPSNFKKNAFGSRRVFVLADRSWRSEIRPTGSSPRRPYCCCFRR